MGTRRASENGGPDRRAERERERGAQGLRRLATAAATAALAAALAGGAQAQLDTDTELTPKAKPPSQWTILGGAEFGREGKLIKDSPTPFTVDFFSTAFSPGYLEHQGSADYLRDSVGFFVGAECADPSTPFSEVESCKRRPAIYGFGIDEFEQPHVDPLPLGGDSAKPGYVAALAWIDQKRALAVGGTGAYPRREPPAPLTGGDAAYLDYDKESWAGKARAWIYQDEDESGVEDGKSEWRELRQLPDGDPKDELPDEMGALTALDCAQPGVTYTGSIEQGKCVAGGMQRLWWWKPAEKDKPEGFDPKPVAGADAKRIVPSGLDGKPIPINPLGIPLDVPSVQVADFHFRVRQIRFIYDNKYVVAVTSGCCANVGVAPEEQGLGAVRAPGARLLTYGDSADKWRSEPFSALGGEDASARGGSLPDSYYAFVGQSAIASPGGQPPADGSPEPNSRIVTRTACRWAGYSNPKLDECTSAVTSRPVEDATYLALDSVRLLAADGDFKPTEAPHDKVVSLPRSGGDGMLDWAVGRFKESEQGVAYTTLDSILPLPNPLTCKISVPPRDESHCGPGGGRGGVLPGLALENVTNHKLSSKRLVAMGTYALNALSFVPGPGGKPDGSLAWAAGDRGALARLGGSGRLGAVAEPDPPALRPGQSTPLSERGPFDPFRLVPGRARAGVVPPLGDRPLERLPQKTLVPWGTADATLPHGTRTTPNEEVSSIAMSRDGSEGWAVGSGGFDRFTLQYFDGERWSRCDPSGLGGVYEHEPDVACQSLRVLLDDGKLRSLFTVARIPLERDGDPSNDDEFEAIAIGSALNLKGVTGATVLRYRDGRWELDVEASKVFMAPAQVQIAFRTPDDGWVAMQNSTLTALYHYSGKGLDGRWVACAQGMAECGQDVELVATGGVAQNLQLQVAGDTVFAAGVRNGNEAGSASSATYPYVMSKKPGAGELWRQEFSGCVLEKNQTTKQTSCRPRTPQEGGTPDDRGIMYSFSMVDLGGGRTAGWLIGKFGSTRVLNDESDDLTRPALGPGHVLLRRDPDWKPKCKERGDPPGCGPWAFRDVKDAADDLIPYAGQNSLFANGLGLVSFRGEDGRERSFLMSPRLSIANSAVSYPPLEYDAERDRWGVLRAPFVSSTNRYGFGEVELATQGTIIAAAPDGQGGLWVAGKSGTASGVGEFTSWPATFFYRYADERRRAVFEDAPNPVREPITGMAGTPDGDVWVATESDRVYRYDRIAGWERLRIKGWDPGRAVTKPSHAFAVAVNDQGVGIVVGERGRIADISDDGVALDPASARRCSDEPPPLTGPCGTPQNLRAAAVAPDGSAIVGGERLTLIWRPAGGQFRLIDRPRLPLTTPITGMSMPVPGRVWLTTGEGELWAGTLVGESWRWRRESEAGAARIETGAAQLNALAVQADGRGLAVGMRGAMLERSPDGHWRRLKTGFTDHLYSIALPPSGYRDGTLVGGGLGVILTRADGRFRIARQADDFDPLTTSPHEAFSARIVGLALSGGAHDGDVEAWAASQIPVNPHGTGRNPLPFALLHYGSDGDRLLQPESRARPLPDTPAAEPGEVTLAAFGRTECQFGLCPPFQGTNLFNEVVTRGIQAELPERRRQASGGFAALFTGDLGSAPGRSEREKRTLGVAPTPFTPLDDNPAQDQWRDLVAGPLKDSEVPLFAVPGKTDLSRARTCWPPFPTGECLDTQQLADAGVSLQWRSTFAGMPKPWGSKEPFSRDGVEFRPVNDGSPSQARVETPGGGARTHYALDMLRDGEPLARLVFIDNSLARSLSASDADQNPVEGSGGQAAWIERVLCIKGETCDVRGGSREPGQPAIVVSNAPTYSYGPGGVDAVQADGSVLEGLLLRHRATAVISGRLGWNGLFYTIAPGLHAPCPGGEYPERPPRTTEGLCTGQSGGAPEPPTAPGARELAESLRGLGAPLPSQLEDAAGAADDARRAIPNLIASTAGGRFGPRGADDGEASKGFWHGYGVLRVRADGEVIVEQRPILDWVGIEAQEHTLRPGQRLTLSGYGREPLGTDTSVRIDQIDSPAITHRYDLVEADPEKPWVPREDADGNYLPLDPAIATVDQQTGAVRAGKGKQARTFAIAILSVGDKAATWPLVFEPRKSFVAKPLQALALPPRPRPAVEAPAPIRVLSVAGATPPIPQPPPSQPPPVVPPALGSPPPPPALPGLPASPPVVEATAPPLPPPPALPTPVALNVSPTIQTVSVAPVVFPVLPPPVSSPVPPVQPAPPQAARRKKVAIAMSSLEGLRDEGVREDAVVDTATGPYNPSASAATRRDPPHPATRRDRAKPAPSFTVVARADQPSAWARGALYGGGLVLAALALAGGFAGPRPRRRPPVVPAPAEARAWHRRP